MLEEVVDFLLIRSKFYPDMFQRMVAILVGHEFPISYPSCVLTYGRVWIMTSPVWPLAHGT
jgi:hypothetical protein